MEKLRFSPETICQDDDYPNFKTLDGILIPPNGNVFIADTSLPEDWESKINALAENTGRQIEVLDALELTSGLNILLPPDEFFVNDDVAVFFPGRGSLKVLEYLDRVRPNLRRILTDKKSLFCVGGSGSFPWFKDFSNYRATIIIDDVVASGKTAGLVGKQILETTEVSDDIYYTRGWKPKRLPSISVYSWLALDASKRSKLMKENKSTQSSIVNITELYTAVIYQGSGIPPCNSLSTLIENTSKSQEIFNGLKTKYFSTEIFDEFINSVRKANEK